MARRISLLLGVVSIMVSLTVAGAQQPPAPSSPAAETNKLALDVLRELHNRGAELYNSDDPVGCLRVYQTALAAVRPFLGHLPGVQKSIDDGLAEAAKLKGDKLQAFKLHEVIEDVRASLKAELQRVEVKPMPDPKPMPMPELKEARVRGVLQLNGQPLPAADVTLVTLGQPSIRVFTASSDTEGKYTFKDALPIGRYAVMVTSTKAVIPARYQSTMTSEITMEALAGENNWNLNLQSK